jgi:RNA polymerase sigma factor (sigma-70 family)
MAAGRKDLNTRKEAWQKFVVQGGEASFKTVFERFYEPLYAYGVKLCSQPEVVKDCLQELFQMIWERRGELGHVESPNVYLFVSLRRAVRKEVKKQRERRGDMPEIGESGFISFSLEEIIIRDEERIQQKEKLRQALNKLPARQKEVLYLHYYNGMSYEEIEEILSIKRQSVRNHIYRAMETLRSLLDMEIMRLVTAVLIAILLLH